MALTTVRSCKQHKPAVGALKTRCTQSPQLPVSVVAVTDARDGSSRWRTFGERTIYDNPWVWLGQIDVELPDGERFWHHVVRLHRAAMMVLVDDQDRVLLLWRHRFVQDKWGWELPGGLIDEGEEPSDDGGAGAGGGDRLPGWAGWSIWSRSSRWSAWWTPSTSCSLGLDPEKIGEPTETTEVERMEWVPLAEVPGLIESGEIWNSGSLVGLLRAAGAEGWQLGGVAEALGQVGDAAALAG